MLKKVINGHLSDVAGGKISSISVRFPGYLLAPIGCLLIRNLFTSGISSGGGNGEDVSRNTVKDRLKALVDGENKKKPYSDEQLAGMLESEGMPISRRTVAKYRMEMGSGGAFQRREE